jgi:hypothetical protein
VHHAGIHRGRTHFFIFLDSIAYAAFIAYGFYIASLYVVTFLSRKREYYADQFSSNVIADPNSLTRALAKIAYGLGEVASDQPKQEIRSAVQSFNIMSLNRGSEGSGNGWENISNNSEHLKKVMRWDLWNPWASVYEFQSTHPLTAKRVLAISEYASERGIAPLMVFDLVQTESYWPRFIVDILIACFPIFLAVGFFSVNMISLMGPSYRNFFAPFIGALFGYALGQLLKIGLSYSTSRPADETVTALLEKTDVSPIQSYPVRLNGKIVGRGDAGNLLSSNLYFAGPGGNIYILYNPPFRIMKLFFAMTRVRDYLGQEVTIEGWFRRGPIPYIELSSIRSATASAHTKVRGYRLTLWGLTAALSGAALLFF